MEKIVVNAEEIKYTYDIQEVDKNKINVICVCNGVIYKKFITTDDEWWFINKKYFQDSFNEFIKILKSSLIENNKSFNIIISPEYLDKLIISIKYNSPFFNFEIDIEVKREPTLEEKFDSLEKQFKLLQDRLTKIEIENSILSKKVKLSYFKTKGWTRIKHSDAWSGRNPQSSSDINEAKKICIEQKYGGFIDCSKHNWYGIRTQASEDKGGPNYVLNNLCKRERSTTEKPWGNGNEWDGDTILSPGAYIHLIKQKQDEGYEIVWDKEDYGSLEDLGIIYMLS